jgi:RHS repeat-associated protein
MGRRGPPEPAQERLTQHRQYQLRLQRRWHPSHSAPTTATGVGETVLYLDGTTEVHYKKDATTAKYWAQRYYIANGQPIALRSNQNGSATVAYLAGDNHGTLSLAVDSTTQNPTRRYSTPFGIPRGTSTGGSWPDDKQFLGKPADTTTGLTHIGAREYDPLTGRFLSVDPILSIDQPQSLNGYAYANDNPTTTSDPTGLRDCGETEYCGKGSRPNLEGGTAASSDAKVITQSGKHVDAAVLGAIDSQKARAEELAREAAAAKDKRDLDVAIATSAAIPFNKSQRLQYLLNSQQQQAAYMAAAEAGRDEIVNYLRNLVDTGQISKNALAKVSVVTAAWDPKTGKVYVGWKLDGVGAAGWCAEDDCAAQASADGVNPKSLQFVAAYRPRTKTVTNICFDCQADFDEEQTLVSRAPFDRGGPWDRARGSANAALAEAEAEAELAESEAMGMAMGLAMAEEE